jgi:hypothetical protein
VAGSGRSRAATIEHVRTLFVTQNWLLLGIALIILCVKIFALVDALARPAAAYVSAGKLTKPAWLLILGLALAVDLVIFYPIQIISLIGTVAAFVYLADARPALRGAG